MSYCMPFILVILTCNVMVYKVVSVRGHIHLMLRICWDDSSAVSRVILCYVEMHFSVCLRARRRIRNRAQQDMFLVSLYMVSISSIPPSFGTFVNHQFPPSCEGDRALTTRYEDEYLIGSLSL
jgi:hypothetical protein